MPRMIVAEEYIQRLLNGENAIESISRLSGFWSARLRGDEPFFGLAIPEFDVQLVLIYTGEVGNGGHEQYFHNRGVGLVEPTINALNRIGLTELRQTIQNATEILSALPEDISSTRRLLSTLSELQLRRLEALDAEVWNVRQVDSRLLDYLRSRQAEILLEERG
jgi:hypothetical protein